MAQSKEFTLRRGWKIKTWPQPGQKPPEPLLSAFEAGYTTLLIATTAEPLPGLPTYSLTWLDENLLLRTIDGFEYTEGQLVTRNATHLWGKTVAYTVTLTFDSTRGLSGSFQADIGEEIVGTFTAQVNPIGEECREERKPPGWLLWLRGLAGSRA